MPDRYAPGQMLIDVHGIVVADVVCDSFTLLKRNPEAEKNSSSIHSTPFADELCDFIHLIDEAAGYGVVNLSPKKLFLLHEWSRL